MSRIRKYSDKTVAEHKKHQVDAEINFMDGTSYKFNEMDTLKMVSASSIFGEPSYYRDGLGSKATLSKIIPYVAPEEKTHTLMEAAIDKALDANYLETIKFASELRHDFMMRLNPAIIMVRAAIHRSRQMHTKEFKAALNSIIVRPDDIRNQFDYYLYSNGSKNNLPNIVKRLWTERFIGFNRYQLAKYKGSIIDCIRVANTRKIRLENKDANELMETGQLTLEEDNSTWERLKSSGKKWDEILSTIKMPHMALLRNLRNIFSEINNSELAKELLSQLKNGVAKGKQFPFRYWSAFNEITKAEIHHKSIVLDTLEECIDIALINMPKLKGKTICLSDNSGSARGAFASEYGSVSMAQIGNLSSIMTGMLSDEGEIGIFGDRLEIIPISKRNGILTQLKNANKVGTGIGSGTENGIWLFFDKIIKNRIHYDNIFIYSDQQAGQGGLYGINPQEYRKYAYKERASHIDVLALLLEYRKINKDVNVFSVQTAGYKNSVLPKNIHRGALLYGWTGKEVIYAKTIIDLWNKQQRN